MRKAKRIGIFGGLFDPPHIGHLIIAQSVLDEFHLDRVLFIPAGNPPHKSQYSPYIVRYKMTTLAIRANSKFSISKIEHAMTGTTYTIEVLKQLKKKLRSILYLIIGSDQWLEIKTWKSPQELVRQCSVIVVPRPHYDIKRGDFRSQRILVSHSPMFDISSSEIRKRIKKNFEVRYLVPPEVYEYMTRKKMYK